MWVVPARVTRNFDVISSDKAAESHTLANAVPAQRPVLASDVSDAIQPKWSPQPLSVRQGISAFV